MTKVGLLCLDSAAFFPSIISSIMNTHSKEGTRYTLSQVGFTRAFFLRTLKRISDRFLQSVIARVNPASYRKISYFDVITVAISMDKLKPMGNTQTSPEKTCLKMR
jgi:hypothetical protein